MNKKNAAIILTAVLLVVCGLYYFYARGAGSGSGPGVQPGPPSSASQAGPPTVADDEGKAVQMQQEADTAAYHPKDIEEIKKQVYDLSIECVEDIPLLDSVVQTGNAPTKDFWQGGWASVDDSKEEINGFKLEPQNDGTFMFYPDEATTRTYTFFETPRTYSYDPAKREFFWEMDYYGKTISHRVRFINDNVVAMMLISGTKVSLDLYQKQSEQHD